MARKKTLRGSILQPPDNLFFSAVVGYFWILSVSLLCLAYDWLPLTSSRGTGGVDYLYFNHQLVILDRVHPIE